MKRLLLLAALLTSSAALAEDPASDAKADEKAAPASTEGSAVTSSLTLRVSDRKAAAKAAIALAEARGGWFSSFSRDAVSLRVPTADTDAVVLELRKLGDVVNRSYSRTDHSQEIAELTARIDGREKILVKYMEVLKSARAKSIVAVEREISGAIQELERLKGRRRYLQARLAHAQVQVRFTFKDRRAPTRDGNSSFAWLNTMNMADLLSDFENGWVDTPSLVEVAVPDGFAPYRKKGRFRAVSPDDVVFRVRSAKNKPRAELPFWQEALRTRMTEAGYKVITDKSFNDGKGYLLELDAANGARDQTYVLGLFVRGGKLVLAEATGEAEVFAGRRAAVVASIEGIKP